MCKCPFRYHFSLSDRADSNRLLCLKFNQSNPRRKQLSALIKTNPTQSSAETNLLSIYLTIQSRSAETATDCSLYNANSNNAPSKPTACLCTYQKLHSLFIHNSGIERLGAMIPQVSTLSGAAPGVSRGVQFHVSYT